MSFRIVRAISLRCYCLRSSDETRVVACLLQRFSGVSSEPLVRAAVAVHCADNSNPKQNMAMKKRPWIAVLLVWGLLGGTLHAASKDLAAEFRQPPDAARMWTWWFWLSDNVDKASITADLEAMKAQGIGGVTVYSLIGPSGGERGPNYLSPEWRELWRHTLKEADRLGLGVSTMLCSGWNCGGPWITPDQACKRHVSSQLVLTGPRHFRGALPKPPNDPRFYRDVAVQGFPLVSGEPEPELTASSSHPQYPVANAADGDVNTFWVSNGEKPNEGPSKDRPEWLQIDLGNERVLKNVRIVPRPGYGPRALNSKSRPTAKPSPLSSRSRWIATNRPISTCRPLRSATCGC